MTDPAPAARRRRRDRHGRGLRGPLLPSGVPSARSRSEQFDDLVLEVVERMVRHAPEVLGGVEIAVADVPAQEVVADRVTGAGPVPLAATATRGGRVHVTLFRRPLEVRAHDRDELADLVTDVLVEEIADALQLDPERIDPDEAGPD